jgi:solute carrier family 31 (copper transporter), member 1
MFFHTSLGMDSLWLRTWMPSSVGTTIAACLGLALLAMFHRSLHVYRKLLEIMWTNEQDQIDFDEIRSNGRESISKGEGYDLEIAQVQSAGSPSGTGLESETRNRYGFRYSRDIIRAVVHLFETGIGYFLMLAVMTFNVWFCELVLLSPLQLDLID